MGCGAGPGAGSLAGPGPGSEAMAEPGQGSGTPDRAAARPCPSQGSWCWADSGLTPEHVSCPPRELQPCCG